jgi:Ca-activated chloride channel family protein
MDASKRFMQRMLTQLRPGDHFRIIRFSDTAGEWSARPMPATPQNIQAGQRYVSALSGGGGTNMTSGIRAALAPPVPDGALRLVVFLTDGYIGNDVEIVRLVQQRRGAARFFSFGVGHSVNRYLIREMARVGRGAARIVLPHEDAGLAADRLAKRLQTPVLTDVEIDFGAAPVHDVTPAALPDLFLGESVRLIGRYQGGGTHVVTVRGRLGGLPVALPLELRLDPDPQEGEASALPILWARAQIEDRMISFLDPGRDAEQREQLKEEVTELGLAHRLLTQWTSFVAVAKPIVNPGGRGVDADVAVSRVKDLADSAYPPDALPIAGNSTAKGAPQLLAYAAGQAFGGAAAPEPGTWTALAGLSLLGALLALRRRRRRARV